MYYSTIVPAGAGPDAGAGTLWHHAHLHRIVMTSAEVIVLVVHN